MRTIILFLLILTSSCSITKYQEKGETNPTSFHEKIPFKTIKSIVLLPVLIDGKPRNMLFDTGSQLNLIQREQLKGKTYGVDGASNRKAKMGSEITASIKIGGVEFTNTAAWNGDMKGLKEQIPDFGGLIGQSIINKANWKIDYPNKQMEIFNGSFSEEGFQTIDIIREEGVPYIMLTVEGIQYKTIVDLGSSSNGINVPSDHPLAKVLLEKYSFVENKREIYTIGGNQMVTEQVGTINSVAIGDINFKNVAVDIRSSSQLRVGMHFFKDKILIIDNLKDDYFVK
ncbi:aspartyl protease family protein [Flammeovirga sp. SJP92]|uniref:aspartyl protease family protein n=1 Tax=Flammeovirga sp. SJP92 TaxID=1775430 RepID=UPI000787104C|nr:aspartyl protease family protein [Flammeovirga sp. SJP92]KXX70746.1 hypothetical protein AVL50_07990 [Flammeovirga sp. SJP92]